MQKKNVTYPQTPNTTAYVERCMLPLYSHQHCSHRHHYNHQRCSHRCHYSRHPQLLVSLTIRSGSCELLRSLPWRPVPSALSWVEKKSCLFCLQNLCTETALHYNFLKNNTEAFKTPHYTSKRPKLEIPIFWILHCL